MAVAAQQSLDTVPRSSTCPPLGEAEFPGPPAMPLALLRLELCLSAPVADLQDITNIIKSDIGLTVQLLRVAAREIEESPDRVVTISAIVVQVGVERLRALVARTRPLPVYFRSHTGLGECERFWTHSRLTALVAEDLAGQSSEVSPEEAYLAGLLYHVGDLPWLLGWATTGLVTANSCPINYRMAEAWRFPRALADVINSDPKACCTRESRALLNIVEAADNWASRLECLAVCESEAVRLRIHLIDQDRLEIPMQKDVEAV
jgi:HD-like signal output (HDOD) protein